MLPGCLPCPSPENPGELKPTLLERDALDNMDDAESRLSVDHHDGVDADTLESIESRRSAMLNCAIFCVSKAEFLRLLAGSSPSAWVLL